MDEKPATRKRPLHCDLSDSALPHLIAKKRSELSTVHSDIADVDNRPLHRDLWNPVLRYMNVNKRYELSRCHPCIEEVERKLPFKIDCIAFGPMRLKVNDTTFTLGIAREWIDGPTPKMYTSKNENGGLCYDLDRFGCRAKMDDMPMIDGDILFNPDLPFGKVDLSRHDYYGRKYGSETINRNGARENIHQGCAECAGLEYESVTDVLSYMIPRRELKDFYNVEEPNYNTEKEKRRALLDWDCRKSLRTKRELNTLRLSMLPYDCRKSNTVPPFRMTMMLTIDSASGRKVERYQYNKPLMEAFRALVNGVFGGRSDKMLHVRRLEIHSDEMRIHMPPGWKIGFKELAINGNVQKVYEQLEKITDAEYTFPLKSLECMSRDPGQFRDLHVPLAEAEHLEIVMESWTDAMMPPYHLLPHQSVFVSTTYSAPHPSEFCAFVGQIVMERRPVGFRYAFGLPKETADECITILKNTHIFDVQVYSGTYIRCTDYGKVLVLFHEETDSKFAPALITFEVQEVSSNYQKSVGWIKMLHNDCFF